MLRKLGIVMSFGVFATSAAIAQAPQQKSLEPLKYRVEKRDSLAMILRTFGIKIDGERGASPIIVESADGTTQTKNPSVIYPGDQVWFTARAKEQIKKYERLGFAKISNVGTITFNCTPDGLKAWSKFRTKEVPALYAFDPRYPTIALKCKNEMRANQTTAAAAAPATLKRSPAEQANIASSNISSQPAPALPAAIPSALAPVLAPAPPPILVPPNASIAPMPLVSVTEAPSAPQADDSQPDALKQILAEPTDQMVCQVAPKVECPKPPTPTLADIDLGFLDIKILNLQTRLDANTGTSGVFASEPLNLGAELAWRLPITHRLNFLAQTSTANIKLSTNNDVDSFTDTDKIYWAGHLGFGYQALSDFDISLLAGRRRRFFIYRSGLTSLDTDTGSVNEIIAKMNYRLPIKSDTTCIWIGLGAGSLQNGPTDHSAMNSGITWLADLRIEKNMNTSVYLADIQFQNDSQDTQIVKTTYQALSFKIGIRFGAKNSPAEILR
jgi:hypothetical protein